MKDKTKFAESLKQCLVENKMKQTELAKKLGITDGAVHRWLNDMSTPTPARIGRIAEILGCSKEWLSGEDVPKDKEIKRNASGYTDPTAYAAIKTIEKEGNEMSEGGGLLRVVEKGGIYEYTLQNGQRKYALCVSDHRRTDKKTAAICILQEVGLGAEVHVNGLVLHINPSRLSYGYVDNFGKFIKNISEEKMKAIEKDIADAVGLGMQKTIACIEKEAAEDIKRMVQSLKDENDVKEKHIEKLQDHIRTISAECSLLSAEANRLREEKRPSDDAALKKAEIERELYKNLYEQALARLMER
jgi:transcriptional regulator with XRE-family HTH domain